MAQPEPGFIESLARRMRDMQDRAHLLEMLAIQLGPEPTHAPLDARRLAQRHVRKARDATDAHCGALEALILASRAETLGDALAQVMVVSGQLDFLSGEDAAEARAREAARCDAALQGVMRVLGRLHPGGLAALGGQSYSSAWLDPWPDVDVSSVTPCPTWTGPCVDGSTMGRAAA